MSEADSGDDDFVPSVGKPLPTYQCTAISKSTGERCTRYARMGSLEHNAKCYDHGGKLPNVTEAAKNRVDAARAYLNDSAEEAAEGLVVLSKTANSEAVKLKAYQDVLDRTVGKAPAELNLGVDVKVDTASEVRSALARLIENKFELESAEDDDVLDAELAEEEADE